MNDFDSHGGLKQAKTLLCSMMQGRSVFYAVNINHLSVRFCCCCCFILFSHLSSSFLSLRFFPVSFSVCFFLPNSSPHSLRSHTWYYGQLQAILSLCFGRLRPHHSHHDRRQGVLHGVRAGRDPPGGGRHDGSGHRIAASFGGPA